MTTLYTTTSDNPVNRSSKGLQKAFKRSSKGLQYPLQIIKKYPGRI